MTRIAVESLHIYFQVSVVAFATEAVFTSNMFLRSVLLVNRHRTASQRYTLRQLLLPLLLLLLLFFLVLSAPSANDDVMRYTLSEEKPPDTAIGNLIADFDLRSRYNGSVIGQLRFAFLLTADHDRQYFGVDEASGVVRSTLRVDRDAICPRMKDCAIKFDVVVKPIIYFQILKVEVVITDLNDNEPIFPRERFVYDLSEAAELGSAFVVPGATDMDSGNFGICCHRIRQPEEIFELKAQSTVDDDTDLRLVLIRKLDRERVDRFQVTVFAMDGGDPPRTGSMVVDIRVVDANDNNPEFQNSSYEISVRESVAKGTVLLQVKATDRDSGSNGLIVYDFSRHTTQEYGQLFGIERSSGEIFLLRELDYEKSAIHLLSVTATDQGPDSLPSHASVVIRVEDVNDNTPQINVNTLTGDGHAAVAENSDHGAFVAHVSVTDPDSADRGRCYCSIDNPLFLLEKMYSTEFKLVTAARFDREKKDLYVVTISCRDFGLISQTSSVALRVHITDENDHAPRFHSESVSYEIPENSPVGSEVATVEANDRDSGSNAEIVYRIDEEGATAADDSSGVVVTIDETTGIIRTRSVLDHEQTAVFLFTVIASDRGVEPKYSALRVTLKVLDEDDERPMFVATSYSFTVFENQPPWTEVGQVVAIDRDSPPLNRFIYFVDKNSDSLSLFEIEPRSGNIRTRQVLDRENRAAHLLTIAVSPDDNPLYSSTASVIVNVGDMNDHRPRFRYPSNNNDTVTVSSQTPRGFTFMQIKGFDLDSGPNGNLTYHVAKGDPSDLFFVDPYTGNLIVNTELDAIDYQEVFLSLMIQDGGSPPLTASAELRVVITKEMPFAEKNRHYSLLANEYMVFVLAITLAAILVAIIVIAVVIVLVRMEDRRRTSKAKKGGLTNGNFVTTIERRKPESNPVNDDASRRQNADQAAAYSDFESNKEPSAALHVDSLLQRMIDSERNEKQQV